MDRVTGSLLPGAVDPRAAQVGGADAGFEAVPRAVSPRGGDRRVAIVTTAAIVVVTLAAALTALGTSPKGASGGQPSQPTPTESADGPFVPPVAARRVVSVAPIGQLTTPIAHGSARTVVAIPGCHLTLQLGARQPRRIVECPEVLPEDLGRMLVVAPGQTLRFEVHGWRVQPPEGADVLAPERAGMWTIEIPTCLSRGTDWVCATWYATVDVRE